MTQHGIATALLAGDLDRAILAGLLDCEGCAACSPACTATLLAARDARLAALAARERYRIRNARLQRRATELAAKRAAPPAIEAPAATGSVSILPSAAALALARAKAKAKAAGRHQP